MLKSSSAPKVGHVTCDNVSNNSTMLKEFAARLQAITGNEYNWKMRKIKYVGSCSLSIVVSYKKTAVLHM